MLINLNPELTAQLEKMGGAVIPLDLSKITDGLTTKQKRQIRIDIAEYNMGDVTIAATWDMEEDALLFTIELN